MERPVRWTLVVTVRKKINFSNGTWLVSFMDYDLSYLDLEEKTLQPLDNWLPERNAVTNRFRRTGSEPFSPPC